MSFHAQNKALIAAGLAKTTEEANALRKRLPAGQTVEQYIAANSSASSFGGATASPAVEMVEIRALMHQEAIPFAAAALLRSQIQGAGGTVADYIGAEASPVSFGEGNQPSTLSVFRVAQNLIKLAGSPEKARQAIELYATFESEDAPTKGRRS